MAIIRFTTTRLSGLQAAGRAKDLQHSVITPLLEQELGAGFGRLFADFETESADLRAWYVDTEVKPVRIDALPPAKQQELRAALAGKLARVLDLARVLERGTVQSASHARVLIAATTFPEEDIWALGDEPLLVNWGYHHRDVPAGLPTPIEKLIKPPPTETPKPKPFEEGAKPDDETRIKRPEPVRKDPARRWWKLAWPTLVWPTLNVTPLLWVLFTILTLGCVWLLLPSCTDLPILSSLKTCRSLAGLQQIDDPLRKDIAAEKARLQAPCPNPGNGQPKVQNEPPPAVKEAMRRIPGARTSEERDVMVFWDGPAEVGLELACPGPAPRSAVSVGQTACGGTIRSESNAKGQATVAEPFDTASWGAPRTEPFSVLVVLRAFNGAPPDTPVPFVMLMRNGFTVTHWATGQLGKVGMTASISQTGF